MACQASLSFTISQSLVKLMFIELVMHSNHLILYCPLLPLPSIFPSITVFSSESILHIRWPKYWSFSFSISPSNKYSGLISFRIEILPYIHDKMVEKPVLENGLCNPGFGITLPHNKETALAIILRMLGFSEW